MALVNFWKKFRFFSFDFCQNFDVLTKCAPKWFPVMLNQRVPISAHAQPTSNQFSRVISIKGNHYPFQKHSKYAEHTRNEFHRWLSKSGMDFIADWVYVDMFKSRKSRPNRIRFSKISCYRPLGPKGFSFWKKCHACVPLNLSDLVLPELWIPDPIPKWLNESGARTCHFGKIS